jgi:hypothetical protein
VFLNPILGVITIVAFSRNQFWALETISELDYGHDDHFGHYNDWSVFLNPIYGLITTVVYVETNFGHWRRFLNLIKGMMIILGTITIGAYF